MIKVNEDAFHDWMHYQIYFYMGTVRYGNFPGYQIIVASFQDHEFKIGSYVDGLEGCDMDAIRAGKKLSEMEEEGDIFIESDNDVRIAMNKLYARLELHFSEMIKEI